MPVQVQDERDVKAGKQLALSLVLHAIVIGGVIGSGLLFHPKGESWGDRSSEASSIQATAVSAIPLPPKQPVNEDNVLASDTPSPAPVQEKQKAEETPAPDALEIEAKKELEKLAQQSRKAVQHPQPVKPQPDRATSGETGGVRVAMTTAQTNVGTSSLAFQDAGFGTRFAYYARQMAQKVSQQWYTGMLTPKDKGKRVWITFRVSRDGTPSGFKITQSSGDPVLDQSGMRALQRIDTFGPLPDAYTGRYLDVQYYFEPNQ